MREPYDAIYLSPHLDDAALSCGGQIARRVRRRERVLVVTLFSGDEPSERLSGLARDLHRYYGLEVGVMASRRAEDREAVKRLGAEGLYRDGLEAPYRRSSRDEPLYPDLQSLFGALHADDEKTVESIGRHLEELPEASEIYAPLAVGNHVDHQIVRRAAEAARREIWYFEEYPYVERRGALRRARGRDEDWKSRIVPLGREELEAKIEACAAYTSQIGPLFKSEARMGRRLRRQARKVGGERCWTKAPGAS